MVFIFLYKNEFVVLLNNHSVPIYGLERLITDKVLLEESSVVERLHKLPQFDYDEDLLIIACDNDPGNNLQIENIKQIIPLTDKAYLAYKRKFGSHINFREPKEYNVELFYKRYLEERISIEMKKSNELFNRYIVTVNRIEISEKLFGDLVQANIDRKLNGKRALGNDPDQQKSFYYTLFLYQAASDFDRTYPVGFLSHLIASFYCSANNIGSIQDLRKKASHLKYFYKEHKGEFNHLSFQSLINLLDKSTLDIWVKFRQSFRKEDGGDGLEGDSIKTGLYTLYFRYLLSEGFSFSDILECCDLMNISIDKELHSSLLLNAIYFDFKKIGDESLHKRNNELFSSVSNADIDEKNKRLIPFMTNEKEKEIEQEIANERKRDEERKLAKEEREAQLYSEYQEKVKELIEKGSEKASPGSRQSKYTEQITNPKSGEKEIWREKKKRKQPKKKEPEKLGVQGTIFEVLSPQSDGISDQNEDVILSFMDLLKDAKNNDGSSEMQLFKILYSRVAYKEEIDTEMKWSDKMSIEDRYEKFKIEYNNRVKKNKSGNWKVDLRSVLASTIKDKGMKSVDDLPEKDWEPIDKRFKENLLNIKGPFQGAVRIDKYKEIYKEKNT
ncbi:hypothetical protein N8Z75_01565 [Crocinitomicaceae bacterium]|nr:hypothetical protein [Crocinitomicaceae bacterium]